MPVDPNQPVSQRVEAAVCRRFRPRPWSIILTLLGCALFIALGFWQIDRGQEQARRDAQVAAAPKAKPLDLARAAPDLSPPALGVVVARAAGHYLAGRQLLLDSQSVGDRVGYDVLTPLQMPDGGILIVNRGWVWGHDDRSKLPDVQVDAKQREVRGMWRVLPAPGLRLKVDNCSARPWPRVVSYPTLTDLRCLYGPKVLAGELLLAPSQADGYVREWKLGGGLSPLRHYSYAVQWFGFAALALFLFFRLNYRPTR